MQIDLRERPAARAEGVADDAVRVEVPVELVAAAPPAEAQEEEEGEDGEGGDAADDAADYGPGFGGGGGGGGGGYCGLGGDGCCGEYCCDWDAVACSVREGKGG